MPQDPGDLRSQFPPVGLAQALDLLRKVFPIERQVRASYPSGRQALGAPQRSGLLLGPAHEILVVERAWLRHVQMMAFPIFVRKSPGRSPGPVAAPI